MRTGIARQRRQEEEEESVFVSMTDMTVGFLFIVILLLAFFASQYDPTKSVPLPVHQRVLNERDELATRLEAEKLTVARLQAMAVQLKAEIADLEAKISRLKEEVAGLEQKTTELTVALESAIAERDALKSKLERAQTEIARLNALIKKLEAEIALLKQPDPLETYINQSLAERKRILEQLRDKISIDFPDLKVVLSEESDALRFQGDGLFRSGSAILRPDRVAFVEALSTRLEQLLPCYTLNKQETWRSDCNSGFALIEAVQIEGHTDSVGSDMANLVLSTARATTTFGVMSEHEHNLVQHLNLRGQPVLSVAGYGMMRPVASNDTVEGKASNRRVDLRIIMYVPSHTGEIERVRAALMSGTPVEAR